MRPALARSYWNIVWLLHYLAGEAFILMPHKPGLGQGHNQKKDTHTLDFDVTLACPVKSPAGGPPKAAFNRVNVKPCELNEIDEQ